MQHSPSHWTYFDVCCTHIRKNLRTEIQHFPICLSWRWRDGSTVRSPGCSCRKSRFSAQHLTGSQPPSAPQDPTPFSGLHRHLCAHTYPPTQHANKSCIMSVYPKSIWHPQRPGESVGPLELESQVVVSHLWVLGI